ncbi:MAG: hypothetical protein HY561_01320, partial [Gemmatimonadetes bacterium]|nr:hypothetical protein [Gemmatimonadota bacterium]
RDIERNGAGAREAERYYRIIRDFLKAAARVWGETWGNANSMVTRPVTLKAMIRVCADLNREEGEELEEGRVQLWAGRLAPWGECKRDFRADGFYERFPAKGQIERVGKIHRYLARAASIEVTRERVPA